jgi:predicted kinase
MISDLETSAQYLARLRRENLLFKIGAWVVGILLLLGVVGVVVLSEKQRKADAIKRMQREDAEAAPIWIQAPDGHWEQQLKKPKPEAHDATADVAVILWFLL